MNQPFARLEQSQLLLELQRTQAGDALELAMKSRHPRPVLRSQFQAMDRQDRVWVASASKSTLCAHEYRKDSNYHRRE